MSKGTVLLVEDDSDIRESLREALQYEGFPVVTAANGQEALDLLRRGSVNPSLVFLDLMMPVLDGRGFLVEGEKDGTITGLTIYILTAAAENFQKEVAGILKKPVDLEVVIAVASRHCSQ